MIAISPIVRFFLAVAITSLTALTVMQTQRLHKAQMDLARMETEHQRQVAALAIQRAQDEAETRRIEGDLREQLDANQHSATAAQNRLRDDAHRERASRERMQHDLSAFVERYRTLSAATSPATDIAPRVDPFDLLVQLYNYADNRAGELAAIADSARARGLACERDYDSARSALMQTRHAQTQ